MPGAASRAFPGKTCWRRVSSRRRQFEFRYFVARFTAPFSNRRPARATCAPCACVRFEAVGKTRCVERRDRRGRRGRHHGGGPAGDAPTRPRGDILDDGEHELRSIDRGRRRSCGKHRSRALPWRKMTQRANPLLAIAPSDAAPAQAEMDYSRPAAFGQKPLKMTDVKTSRLRRRRPRHLGCLRLARRQKGLQRSVKRCRKLDL